jgi:hypothetical protein
MSFFITLLIYAVLFVLSDLLTPKPELENAKPAGIGDFNFPTATEQRKVPLLFGTVRIAGPNVVWWGDLIQEAIVKSVKVSMFKSTSQVVGFRYHLGTQEALCEGPIDDLLRVWIDEDLVYDAVDGPDLPVEDGDSFTIDEPELFGGEELGQGGMVGTFKLWAGSALQAVSPYLAEFQKFPAETGDTPAYRGYCYIAPETDPIYVGNATTIKPRKWEVRRCPNGLGMVANKHRVNTYDANIACVLFEAMTNLDWGQRIPSAQINQPNLIEVGEQLYDEGNGFSMLIDSDEDVGDLIRRLEQQADMVVYQNPFSGKWEAKLIRADYDIDDVPELNVDNVIEVTSYTQGTWEDTKNQVSVPFFQRSDGYKGTYGFAQDMANVRIVGKKTPTQVTHPGVKDAALANALAWRALRTLSQPLIAMKVTTDRSVFGVLPGDVRAFTHPIFNAVKIPMRVQSVDYGDLLDGAIRLQCVQDVFFASAGSFATPPSTGWHPPADTLVAFPPDEQLAFEAPRALVLRDPLSTDPNAVKVFAAARRQGPEVTFKIRERHASGSPSGAFAVAGEVFGFLKIGELQSALNDDSAYPHTSFIVEPDPDTQGAILNAFPIVTSIEELGQDLDSLIYIDGEFMLVTSASASTGNVQINGVYRGVLDSGQRPHAAGVPVYLLFVGAGMSDGAFPGTDNVEVKLTPRSFSDEVPEASATTIAFAFANRARRPYPPSEFDLNGVRLDRTSVDLDGSGAGENVGVLIDAISRRDFRTLDEIAVLGFDAATLAPDFPAANTTTHALVVKNGSTVLVVEDIGAAVTGTVRQLDILQALDTTTLPASLTFGVRATHLLASVSYDSFQDCQVLATIASDFIGKHAFGAKDTNQISTAYVVLAGDDTTDHVFTLSSAFTLGNVEYRINGGGFSTLILAGLTTGLVPNGSIAVGDTIEIRHTSTDVGAQKLAAMTVGANTRAYGVLFT